MKGLQGFFHAVAAVVFHLGGVGLLLVGIADSSPLTFPMANDVLVVALSASHHTCKPYYVVMAAVGSVIGCAITDAIGRTAEKEVRERTSSSKFKFVESQFRKRAGWALAVAALLPPPFPFTPFVAVAAGAQYPRKKLLTVIGCARLVRFGLEGGLAIVYGRGILALADSPAVRYLIIALILIAMGGSGFTVFEWIRKKKGGRKKST